MSCLSGGTKERLVFKSSSFVCLKVYFFSPGACGLCKTNDSLLTLLLSLSVIRNDKNLLLVLQI